MQEKSTTVARGRKVIFPFCRTFQAIERARCRLFQPFNMNVSGFIVHFENVFILYKNNLKAILDPHSQPQTSKDRTLIF